LENNTNKILNISQEIIGRKNLFSACSNEDREKEHLYALELVISSEPTHVITELIPSSKEDKNLKGFFEMIDHESIPKIPASDHSTKKRMFSALKQDEKEIPIFKIPQINVLQKSSKRFKN
jgi:hypothetical protein